MQMGANMYVVKAQNLITDHVSYVTEFADTMFQAVDQVKENFRKFADEVRQPEYRSQDLEFWRFWVENAEDMMDREYGEK